MFVYVLLVCLQLAVAVHALKTGRAAYWIFIVAFVPLLGVYTSTPFMPSAV